MKLNPNKCEFAKTNLTFLSHVVSHNGTQFNPRKIKVITEFPIPTSMINVLAFLGPTSYYRNHVKRYFRMVLSLFDVTKKDNVFDWNPNCHNYFDLLEVDLVFASIIIKPNFTKAFILDVDWSIRGVGAIPSQKDGRNERVIVYASKGLSHV